MDSLLFEIGTEEVPAGYIEPALDALSKLLIKRLDEARIEHGLCRTYGTPRRLAVFVENIAEKQETKTTEITGPPEKVGFDSNGVPTIAAKKFAEKVGVLVEQLKIKKTKKGSYLCGERVETGLFTIDILSKVLPEIITALPFPKTMRWSIFKRQFARPVRSILAVIGSRVIPFEFEGVTSSENTFGHRFMSKGKIKISDPSTYPDLLEKNYVIADINKRKNMIKKQIAEIAGKNCGTILVDEQLENIVNNLIELPVSVMGYFDLKYLELPEEILITAMREHQKYFAVIDENKKLKACFIAVNNTCPKDLALVASGHERVLRARLEDASFFYKSDSKLKLEKCVEKLKGVLFHKKLGTVYDKVLRVQKTAEEIGRYLEYDLDLMQKIERAAYLCKADLVTQVVVEFPKLQGVMGRVYSLLSKEDKDVAYAIEEHYLPVYSGGKLPQTDVGAVLSIADKIDTICGCFCVGLIPTGASDPYALRRQCIGIIQIVLDKKMHFSLKKLIQESVLRYLETDSDKSEAVISDIFLFIQNRVVHILSEKGFSKDVIVSVITTFSDDLPDIVRRVEAVEEFKGRPDFEPLVTAFKRTVNILKKVDISLIEDVDINLFEHKSESALFGALSAVKKSVLKNIEAKNYKQAIIEIASLRDVVDDFFDNVLVMDEDELLRKNRFALLKAVSLLFEKIADFSKILIR